VHGSVQCVASLVESATAGPKCHVMVDGSLS